MGRSLLGNLPASFQVLFSLVQEFIAQCQFSTTSGFALTPFRAIGIPAVPLDSAL